MVNITVVDDAERSRFEARTPDGEVVGFIDHRPARYAGEDSSDGDLEMVHTEVDPAAEGTGVGSTLARAALDAVRASGSEVLPYCPFVKGWIARHPEYVDLVPQDQRAKFDL